MQRPLTVALAGNPNAGKSTLFNALTGARQHVGNYPGITVDKKEGRLQGVEADVRVVDLPGAYSLTAYSQEELVARDMLALERPDAVVDVLNAGALERNLYLGVQLLELGVPLILALNMMDEAKKHGLRIDGAKLGKLLGLPVVELIAKKGVGVAELAKIVTDRAAMRAQHPEPWRPLVISYGPELDDAIASMTTAIEAAGFLTDRYPARWVAIKYLENDPPVMEEGRRAGAIGPSLEAMAAKAAAHCNDTLNTYPEAIIADYRYGFISSILKNGVLSRDDRLERVEFSDKIDRVLTHKFLGPVAMLGVLYLVYKITFGLGRVPMNWMQDGFSLLGETATSLLPEGLLRSLLVSGVIDGAGGVLSFVPLILIIFMLIAFLEDSGYMARIAYMLDRVFRIFGLHGCSVMPFIISGGIAGGCAVPGVMASRTLRSPKEKLATLLTVPFMTCGAKLPVFILLTGVFFPRFQALVLFAITLSGWAAALCVAWFLRKTMIAGPSTPFVMELPPYRLPTWKGLCIHTWERTWQYIRKAGSVILAISVLLWAAMTFPGLPGEEAARYEAARTEISAALDNAKTNGDEQAVQKLTEDLGSADNERAAAALRHSIAGRAGIAVESVSRYAGFDWRTNIALIGGFAAKEVIVSTLGTAYSLGKVESGETTPLAEQLAGDPAWTMLKGVSLIVFILLYAPCFITVVAIARETGSWRWALFSTAFNTGLAFALAAGVYQIGTLMGLGH
ncbi:MAG: ferrous iron transport protein B [Desulfovibrionaceae bacterium]|nr:ferrous iron transport protein B [Desulfovibrionaceae bacterium]